MLVLSETEVLILSAVEGLALPARRLVLRSFSIGGNFLDPRSFSKVDSVGGSAVEGLALSAVEGLALSAVEGLN